MASNRIYNYMQLYSLVILRFAIGWHLLFEGLSKLLNPNWSSVYFLRESQWIMSGFANWVLSNDNILAVTDQLNTWGLIAIGTCLIVGLFGRISAFFGFVLLLMYYLNSPPLIGLEYSVASDGNNLIINKALIESLALLVLALFPTSRFIGLDLLIDYFKNKELNYNGKSR